LIFSITVGLLSNTNVKSLTKMKARHWGWHHE